MKRGFGKGFASGILVAALTVGLGVSALAATRTITVDDNIRVTLNGAVFSPKNEQGKEVPLFSYNGTTYAPVRAICEAAGMKVEFDSASYTAVLTTQEQYIATDPTASNYITADRAKEIALEHAGISASNAVFVKAGLDWDDGRTVYEVEFYANNTEYDYEIDPASGKVLSYDREWDDFSLAPVVSAGTTGEYISVDKAKQIALDHAGISASSATFVFAKMDWDDGRMQYDVEFYANNIEYDYEIDAVSGSILSYDRDWDNTSQTIPGGSGSTTGASITEARAKEIALNHAGVSVSSATFVYAKPDWDDGRYVYDVEFYAGSIEYDYEIDANTGAILSYDHDWDNTTQTIPAGTDLISADRAKEIALGRAPSGVTVVKCQLERDDGRYIYEIEMRSGRTEYSCDIDAATGTIFDWDVDYD